MWRPFFYKKIMQSHPQTLLYRVKMPCGITASGGAQEKSNSGQKTVAAF